MSETRRVDPVVDKDGWIVQGGYTAWTCDCGCEVRSYRGDTSCDGCDQPFNAWGQRLRRDYRSNRSMYDDDVSDMDGYEQSQSDW